MAQLYLWALVASDPFFRLDRWVGVVGLGVVAHLEGGGLVFGEFASLLGQLVSRESVLHSA